MKRIISLLLALLLCVSLLPAATLADEEAVDAEASESAPAEVALPVLDLAPAEEEPAPEPAPEPEPEPAEAPVEEPAEEEPAEAPAEEPAEEPSEASAEEAAEEAPVEEPLDDPEEAPELDGANVASGTCGDSLTWTLTDAGVLTISGSGAMTDWTSESSVPWYSNRSSITQVKINSGATSIGAFAFHSCTALTSITIPTTVTSIGNRAFYKCSALPSITIPSSVTSIGTNFTFSYCSSLTTITVNSSNTTYASADGVLFNKAKTQLIVYPAGKSGSYTIPSTVTSIAADAFFRCDKLTGITLDAKLQTINSEAFCYCTGLTSVTIPASVTSLGVRAFAYCSALSEITFQGNAPSINSSAFNSVTAAARYPAGNLTWTSDKQANYGGTLTWTEYGLVASGVCGANGDNLRWVLNDNGMLTISGSGAMADYANSDANRAPWYDYRTQITSLVISGATTIGNYAFYYCIYIASVSFGSDVTTIGDYAFGYCYALPSITIPSSVTTIKQYGFYYCKKATTVSIPAGVTSIGNHAFTYCDMVTSFTVNSSNTAFSSQNGVLFNKDKTKLLWYPDGNTRTSYTVPASVKTLSQYSFAHANNLTSVNLNQVTTFEAGVFYRCDALTSITIPDTVASITYNCFAYSKALETVTIGTGVTKILGNAFISCTGITTITFTGSAPTINSTAFQGVTATAYYPGASASWTADKLQDYGGTITWVSSTPSGQCGDNVYWSVSGGVLTLSGTGETYDYPYDPNTSMNPTCPAPWAEYNDSITSIVVESGVTRIGINLFRNCSASSVSLPNTLTEISAAAFYSCENLTSIRIPDSVTEFGNYVFEHCVSLTSVTLPANITTIEYGMFLACESLPSVDIPDTVTEIGHLAFMGCEKLSGVEIPDGVTWIGQWAFDGCESLTSLTIPASVEIIYDFALRGCTGLTELNLSDGLIEIYDGAFENCDALTSVDIPDTVTELGQGAFMSCNGLQSVRLSNSVTMLEYAAFMSCTSLTSVTIPASVTTIAEKAFYNDIMLSTITFEGHAPTFGSDQNCQTFSNELIFTGVTATAYYPWRDETWTEDKLQNYGGWIMWVSVAPTSGQCGDDVYWSMEDSVLTITGTGPMWDYPSDDPTYFDLRGSITSVVIESGVTAIGQWAFYDFTAMTEITIPASVTIIGQGAFRGSRLNSVTIPASVTSIGFGAFYTCSSLTEITFQGSAPTFGGNVFYNVTATAYYPGGDASWTEDVRQGYGGTITWTPVGGVVASGQCGDNVYWSLEGGVLTITGTGPMWDFSSQWPTYSNYSEDITSVVIESGVTSIGAEAFYYLTAMASVTIPSSVTSIGKRVFYHCESLTDITIPVGVTSIGDSAFYYCTSLTSITIPASVTSIGNSAFNYCESLTSITIPAGVTSIGDSAFENCESLTSVTIPASVTSIGKYAFYSCESLTEITFEGAAPTFGNNVFYNVNVIAFYPADDASWTAEVRQNYGGTITWVPSGGVASGQCGDDVYWVLTSGGTMTVYGTGAMWDFDTNHPEYYSRRGDILTVEIGSGVTRIGNYAFSYLDSMIGITIPASVTVIGFAAFGYCDSLTEITIPAGVTSIEDFAFDGCAGLTRITFLGAAPTFDDNVFYGITAEAHYPALDESWTSEVRQNYSGTITWVADDPSGQCGDDVFWTLKDGVLTITGTGPMWDYSSGYPTYYKHRSAITSVVIGSGVTAIGIDAFYYLTAMTSATIPSSVTSIGNRAFNRCDSLTDITIPNSVTSIGRSAFYSCSSLTSITIPTGVTSIENYVFEYCTSLSSITIPASVTSIGADAFYGCSSLASVTIPAGVTSIGYRAFYNCSSLTAIGFRGEAPTFGDDVFYSVTATAYYPADDATWTEEIRQDYGGTITWVPYDPVLDAAFSHSTSLGNNLTIVYYVPTSYAEGYDNVRLHVEKNKYNTDGTYTVSEYDITEYSIDTKNGVDRFRFAFSNIAAKEIGDDVRATIRAEKDGITFESAVDVYSVKIYAMNQINKSSTPANLKTLLVDLLNYGAQAQVYFKYNKSNLANADLTAAQQALGTQTLGELTSCESTTATPGATAQFSSKSVVLGNEIAIKYYMKFAAGQSLDNVRVEFTYTTVVGTQTTVSFDASTFDYDSANDRYTVRLQTIAAKDAGRPVTAKIYDGETLISEVFTYSIETYAYNQLKKESLNANARAIITAMMKFCKSAEAYF